MSTFDNIRSKDDILGIVNSKEFENLFHTLNSQAFSTLLDNALVNPTPMSKDEIYEELASHYFSLLHLLKIDNFNSFTFPDHEDCRTVAVDGIVYDFDSEFCHDDSEAANALCAIDCLMADLEEESFSVLLKKIEKKMNQQGE